MKKLESGDSAIYKIYEKPNEEDDPMQYNLPSFNSKSFIKKSSNGWPGEYRNLN